MNTVLLRCFVSLVLCSVTYAWLFDTPDLHRRQAVPDDLTNYNVDKRAVVTDADNLRVKYSNALATLLRYNLNRDDVISIKELCEYLKRNIQKHRATTSSILLRKLRQSVTHEEKRRLYVLLVQ